VTDGRRRTPVPTNELVALTKAVASIETKVDTIKDEQLPPVAAAAQAARDGVIELKGWNRDIVRRVEGLESAPAPPHACAQESTIREHSKVLSGHGERLSGLSRWRWWIAVASVTLGLAAASAAGSALWTTAQAETERTEVRRDVDRHEEHIEAIERAYKADRVELLDAVGQVPRRVKKILPAGPAKTDLDAVVEDADDFTDWERRQLLTILRRREKRRSGNGGGSR